MIKIKVMRRMLVYGFYCDHCGIKLNTNKDMRLSFMCFYIQRQLCKACTELLRKFLAKRKLTKIIWEENPSA